MRNGKVRAYLSGFSFIGLLIMLFIIGLALAEAGALYSQERKREREKELLKIGDQFRIAIGRYYNESPGLVKQYPPDLQALLKDNRGPQPKRYLRRIPRDPINNSEIWGTVLSGEGGIMGIYSSAAGKPLKTSNFRPIYKSFENKQNYSDWRFTYSNRAPIQAVTVR